MFLLVPVLLVINRQESSNTVTKSIITSKTVTNLLRLKTIVKESKKMDNTMSTAIKEFEAMGYSENDVIIFEFLERNYGDWDDVCVSADEEYLYEMARQKI